MVAVAITRTDLTTTELRGAAARCRDAQAARRMLASLVATCKMSGVNPVNDIAATLRAILDGNPQSPIEDLMPGRDALPSSLAAQGNAVALTVKLVTSARPSRWRIGAFMKASMARATGRPVMLRQALTLRLPGASNAPRTGTRRFARSGRSHAGEMLATMFEEPEGLRRRARAVGSNGVPFNAPNPSADFAQDGLPATD